MVWSNSQACHTLAHAPNMIEIKHHIVPDDNVTSADHFWAMSDPHNRPTIEPNDRVFHSLCNEGTIDSNAATITGSMLRNTSHVVIDTFSSATKFAAIEKRKRGDIVKIHTTDHLSKNTGGPPRAHAITNNAETIPATTNCTRVRTSGPDSVVESRLLASVVNTEAQSHAEDSPIRAATDIGVTLLWKILFQTVWTLPV